MIVSEFIKMGTPCALKIPAKYGDLAALAISTAQFEIGRIQDKYSRFDKNSILSEINNIGVGGGNYRIDDETISLFEFCFKLYEMSDGLFDVTAAALYENIEKNDQKIVNNKISMKNIFIADGVLTLEKGVKIDFGGIGKEYAVDRVADIWLSMGINDGLIDLGGDIRAIGRPNVEKEWVIDISNPWNDNSVICINLNNQSLATSGTYARNLSKDNCHIVNPLSCSSVRHIVSASILANTCMIAGAYSTLATLMEHRAKEWLEEQRASYCLIDENGIVSTNIVGI